MPLQLSRMKVKLHRAGILRGLILLSLNIQIGQNFGAVTEDSTKPIQYLPDVNVVGMAKNRDAMQLPEIVGTQIYAGKKNSLIILKNLNAIVVNNNMRQILAKVPGIHIWESDPSGIQIGIAARGLSPNRSWEFNTRQNGYDIASDPFGYPEAYYSPPMNAVQKIQVVRGAGALQYGPQFGGMVNYVLKDGSETKKPVEIETQQAMGSYGLFNTYNAIGGQTKNIHYYVFFDQRQGNGWRENSHFQTRTVFGTLTWKIKPNIHITAEQTAYTMLSQQPGGLTDAGFEKNAQTSLRSRNWMNIPWYVSALKFNWDINEKTRIQARAFYLYGDRKSVGFMKSATTPDTISSITGEYAAREVARDKYSNYGMEVSFLKDYTLGAGAHTFTAGLRYYDGITDRWQKGVGSKDSKADFSVNSEGFPTAFNFQTHNIAGYLENVFRLGKKWLIIPGIRFENIISSAQGRVKFGSSGQEIITNPEKRTRQMVLPGIGIEYHLLPNTEIYANYSHAYRPVLFSDLIQNNTTDVIDPNLRDASGYNADFGIRGNIAKFVRIDIGGYYLQYNNRIASLSRLDSTNNTYNFRTNVGSSSTWGVEALIETDVMEILAIEKWKMPIYVSYAQNNATYNHFPVTSVNNNVITESSLKGKRVENAPRHIMRFGWGIQYQKVQLNVQGSYVSSFFTDAQNTEIPSSNGQSGKITGYTVWDCTLNIPVYRQVALKLSVNNISDTRYATRRAGGYPGPGLLPADGRCFLASISAHF